MAACPPPFCRGGEQLALITILKVRIKQPSSGEASIWQAADLSHMQPYCSLPALPLLACFPPHAGTVPAIGSNLTFAHEVCSGAVQRARVTWATLQHLGN